MHCIVLFLCQHHRFCFFFYCTVFDSEFFTVLSCSLFAFFLSRHFFARVLWLSLTFEFKNQIFNKFTYWIRYRLNSQSNILSPHQQPTNIASDNRHYFLFFFFPFWKNTENILNRRMINGQTPSIIFQNKRFHIHFVHTRALHIPIVGPFRLLVHSCARARGTNTLNIRKRSEHRLKDSSSREKDEEVKWNEFDKSKK